MSDPLFEPLNTRIKELEDEREKYTKPLALGLAMEFLGISPGKYISPDELEQIANAGESPPAKPGQKLSWDQVVELSKDIEKKS